METKVFSHAVRWLVLLLPRKEYSSMRGIFIKIHNRSIHFLTWRSIIKQFKFCNINETQGIFDIFNFLKKVKSDKYADNKLGFKLYRTVQ